MKQNPNADKHESHSCHEGISLLCTLKTCFQGVLRQKKIKAQLTTKGMNKRQDPFPQTHKIKWQQLQGKVTHAKS